MSAPQVSEECDAKSPFSYQFIDPTSHRLTYGGNSTHPVAALCQQLLAGLPELGATLSNANTVALKRGHSAHRSFDVSIHSLFCHTV